MKYKGYIIQTGTACNELVDVTIAVTVKRLVRYLERGRICDFIMLRALNSKTLNGQSVHGKPQNLK